MINFEFNKELNILEVRYSGIISLNDLIEFGNQIYEDNSLPKKLFILTDVTQAEYHIGLNEFPELLNNLQKHVSRFEYVRAAFIQSRPKETAYSILLSTENHIDNYYHEVFYTREAALHWLIQ